MESLQLYLIPTLLGIGLSAACGLRVFFPLFLVSLLGYLGKLSIAENFLWLTQLPAVITFGVASVVEMIAYFIPLIDHLLDAVTIPSSIVSGIVLFASMFPENESLIKWIMAIIAGGGTAGLVSGLTSVTRLKSTAFTAGLGNPLIAFSETVGSVIISVLSVLFPLFVILIIALLIYLVIKSNRFIKRT
jgi:hypothetical protein